MQICLLCPEVKKLSLAKESVERFSPRIRSFTNFEFKEFKCEKNGDALFKKEKEEKEILKQITEKDILIALDEKGKELNSVLLSQKLDQINLEQPSKRIVFLIGGPYGLSVGLKKRADVLLSLSRLTFNSEVAITVFAEQLYRILTIKFGHPYHNN